MKCTKYSDRDAGGICSYSGKPYCAEELVDVGGKLVAKENVANLLAEVKDQAKSNHIQPTPPIVFMNAGGGNASSASAAAGMPGYVGPYGAMVGIKSKATAGLLALLLGGIGVHKFYLGKPLQGVLYLLFFWTFVPSLIALVEGIYYLTINDHDWALRYGGAVRVA